MPYFTYELEGSAFSQTSATLALETFRSQEKNLHLLSLTRIVSRLVRENTCSWFVLNFQTEKLRDLSQKALENLIFHALSLLFENFAAVEISNENLYDIVVLMHMALKVQSCLALLTDEETKEICNNYIQHCYQIHTHLVNSRRSRESFDQGDTLLLWGQSFLKLASYFYVPGTDIGKSEYFRCLDIAIGKFESCIVLVEPMLEKLKPLRNTSTIESNNYLLLEKLWLSTKCSIGYAILLKGKACKNQNNERRLLIEAKKAFNSVYAVKPHPNCSYNLVCVAALLDQDYEVKERIDMCVKDKTLPPYSVIASDSDLNSIRNEPWFPKPPSAPTTPVETDPDSFKRTLSPELSVLFTKKTDGPSESEIRDVLQYDEDLNKLQASLLRDGFSVSTAFHMITEVYKGKTVREQDLKKIEKNREILNQRLKLAGLREKRPIPGDGNCQMSSISDQIYGDIQHAKSVREKAVAWLRKNPNWLLPNGAQMKDFVHDKTWEEYCNEISKDGIWGDHLTLVAIAEVFGANIQVISSVAGDNYTTQITPKTASVHNKTLLLSHYAEFHYGSLEIDPLRVK